MTHETITLRPYQQEAVDAVYRHLRERDDNPCVVIPTAGGKTPVMATICRDAVQRWNGRVLILAHVKELLEQAVEKLHVMAPDLWNRIGVYSAGLNCRDTEHPIIVAGIQSVYQRAPELDAFNLILVDEAHMLPPDGEGRYRTFLAEATVVNPHVRLIGLTATPYRMTTGMICDHDNLLNHVCYEVGVRELIVQGYLCRLRSKAGRHKVDTSGLHIRAGEFVAGEVEDLMDDEVVVEAACGEIVEQTHERNSVLIFAAGVAHAMHVQAQLRGLGYDCGLVTGATGSHERAEILAAFKTSALKYLVNVNVLTTGFDAPNIDCIALLRPTNSPGLYYQMVGRGFRLHPDKDDCLILDFGGNILRHGPVDALVIRDRTKGEGEAPAKECPECHSVIHAAYAVCPDCGYKFPPPEKKQHDRYATTAGVLSGEVTDEEYEIGYTDYHVHWKKDAASTHPTSMRVEHWMGVGCKREWICFEHTGYARQKAEAWWRARSDDPVPDTVAEAVALCKAGAVAETLTITVRSVAGEKYDRIIKATMGEKPEVDGVPVAAGKGDAFEGDLEEQAEPWWGGVPEDDIPF